MPVHQEMKDVQACRGRQPSEADRPQHQYQLRLVHDIQWPVALTALASTSQGAQDCSGLAGLKNEQRLQLWLASGAMSVYSRDSRMLCTLLLNSSESTQAARTELPARTNTEARSPAVMNLRRPPLAMSHLHY